MKLRLTLFVSIATSILAFSQDDWKWGDQPKESKGAWDYMVRLIETDKLVEAGAPCNWLLTNTPDLNVGLYIYAEKVYKARIKAEKNKDHEEVLEDSLLWIYDNRIVLYGDEAKILNKKAKVAWRYQYKDKSKHAELYEMYKKTYALNGSKTYDVNLFYYFSSATRQLKAGELTEAELLELYNTLNADFESRKLQAAGDADEIEDLAKYQEKIDKELNNYVKLDCQFVENNYAPKFKTSPSVELGHKMQDLMKNAGDACSESDLFLDISKFLISQEGATYGNLKNIGNVYYKKGNMDSAYVYYERAIAAGADSASLGQSKMDLALIDRKAGRKQAAISNVRAAMAYDPSLNSEGHTMIGDMYIESAGDCSKGDALEDRLVYIAAYNEYKKAGNNSKMASAKAQFPSMEEIFVRNHKVGETMNTGCWTNVQVTLNKRD